MIEVTIKINDTLSVTAKTGGDNVQDGLSESLSTAIESCRPVGLRITELLASIVLACSDAGDGPHEVDRAEMEFVSAALKVVRLWSEHDEVMEKLTQKGAT